jgi:hypothetical protein
MIINSLVVNTPGCQGKGPEFNPRRELGVFEYNFGITTYWYTIFLQQTGLIKIPRSKVDLVSFGENKIECK